MAKHLPFSDAVAKDRNGEGPKSSSLKDMELEKNRRSFLQMAGSFQLSTSALTDSIDFLSENATTDDQKEAVAVIEKGAFNPIIKAVRDREKVTSEQMATTLNDIKLVSRELLQDSQTVTVSTDRFMSELIGQATDETNSTSDRVQYIKAVSDFATQYADFSSSQTNELAPLMESVQLGNSLTDEQISTLTEFSDSVQSQIGDTKLSTTIGEINGTLASVDFSGDSNIRTLQEGNLEETLVRFAESISVGSATAAQELNSNIGTALGINGPVGDMLGEGITNLGGKMVSGLGSMIADSTIGQIAADEIAAIKKRRADKKALKRVRRREIKQARYEKWRERFDTALGRKNAKLIDKDAKARDVKKNKVDARRHKALTGAIGESNNWLIRIFAIQAIMAVLGKAWTAAISAIAAAASAVGLGGKGGAAATGKPSKLGKVAKFGGGVLAAGLAGYDKQQELKDREDLTGAQKTTQVATTAIGAGGGAVAGAMAGAAIGSIIPGIGTVIGGIIGGALGAWAGSEAGEATGELISKALPDKNSTSVTQDTVAKYMELVQSGMPKAEAMQASGISQANARKADSGASAEAIVASNQVAAIGFKSQSFKPQATKTALDSSATKKVTELRKEEAILSRAAMKASGKEPNITVQPTPVVVQPAPAMPTPRTTSINDTGLSILQKGYG